MLDLTAMDVLHDRKSIKAVKKPVQVQVRFAHIPETIATLEGPVACEAGDAILTGSKGESWPVKRHKFNRKYVAKEPGRNGEDGIYMAREKVIFALKLEDQGVLRIVGGTLIGEPGDWLVRYGQDEYGIVSAVLFGELYTMMGG